MTRNDDMWTMVAGGDDVYYHDWAQAPKLIGWIYDVVMKEMTDEVRYYLIDCGKYQVRVYPYATLSKLTTLTTGSAVKIEYRGVRKSQQGNRLYSIFNVAYTAQSIDDIAGLYDREGKKLDNIDSVAYNDDTSDDKSAEDMPI